MAVIHISADDSALLEDSLLVCLLFGVDFLAGCDPDYLPVKFLSDLGTTELLVLHNIYYTFTSHSGYIFSNNLEHSFYVLSS